MPPGDSGRPSPLVPCFVILVHLAYLLLIFAVQSPDHLGEPDSLAGELYGDQDLAAITLRGLNANAGRSAGRMDPPGADAETFSKSLEEEKPLLPRYYLEYPHVNCAFFCLPWWIFGPLEPLPSAILDGDAFNLTYHTPRDDRERAIWRQLRRASIVYRVVLFLLLSGVVIILWRGYLPDGDLSSSCWPLFLPCALSYTVNRFDILPVFFTTLALALLGRRHHLFAGICLAIGAMSKIFPGLLLPLVLRYLLGQPGGRRAAAIWLVGFALTVLACLLPPLAREGLVSVWSPYEWQMNRQQFLWTAYGYILPPFLGGGSAVARGFRTGFVLLALCALTWRPIPDMAALVRRCGVLVCLFVLLQNVFSPQWILWFWPFVLPLLGRHSRLVWLIVVLDLATMAIWPHGPPWTFARDCLQSTRLAAMLGILGVLLLGCRQESSAVAERALVPTAS